MQRADLEHIIRAAAVVAQDNESEDRLAADDHEQVQKRLHRRTDGKDGWFLCK